MKALRNPIVLLSIILFPLSLWAASPGDIHLRFVEGDVEIQAAGASDWVLIDANTPLQQGDRLWVPEGARAETFLSDGTALRLGENSYLEVVGVDKESFHFYLERGHLYGNYAGSRGKALAVDTPSAPLRVYGRAVFMTDVAESGDSEVSVFGGQIFADAGQGETKIASGERLVFANNAEPKRTSLLNPDEFQQWNSQRDKEVYAAQEGESGRYLPEELRPYAGDFDQYGNWVNTPDDGYAWAPGYNAEDYWSPYRTGYWGPYYGDYVWIPYEPWGWVPYHYGRWKFARPFGWCWVPPRKGFAHWGPGYVGWHHTATHVSWVPLSPRDTYYGYGHFGPQSVNMSNANLQRSPASGVYRNASVNNAVVSVQRDSFFTNRPRAAALTDNPFMRQQGSVMGAPRIRPVQAAGQAGTRLPLQASLPPRQIRTNQLAFSRVPVQAGDVSVWKVTGENGVQHYIASNLHSGRPTAETVRYQRADPPRSEGAQGRAAANSPRYEPVRPGPIAQVERSSAGPGFSRPPGSGLTGSTQHLAAPTYRSAPVSAPMRTASPSWSGSQVSHSGSGYGRGFSGSSGGRSFSAGRGGRR